MALASLSAALALLHLSLFILRRRRIQLWFMLTFIGWASLNTAVALSSVAVGGTYTLAIHFGLGVPAALGLWVGPPCIVWALRGGRFTNSRMFWVLAVVVVCAVRAIDVPMYIRNAGGPVTWEDVHNTFNVLTAVAFWMMGAGTVGHWLYQGMVEARNKVLGALMAVCGVWCTAIILWEMRLLVGWGEGPTFLGLASLAFFVLSWVFNAVMFGRALDDDMASRYRIVRQVGQGGMGDLFEAVRRGPAGFERRVALKTIISRERQTEEDQTRFLIEAKVAAQLSHPNIVSVFDLGKTSRGWFMAMEYIDGVSLAELRRASREQGVEIPLHVVATIGERVCRGLAYAHQRGVIHRDISPQNIMVSMTGQIQIIDFGIARLTDEETKNVSQVVLDELERPETKGVIGKLRYFSPERFAGETATVRSDLYALMLVLYELACLRYPFEGDTAKKRAHNMVQGNLIDPRSARREMSAEMGKLFARGLDAVAENQFPHAEELAKAFQHCRSAETPASLEDLCARMFPDRASASGPAAPAADTDTAETQELDDVTTLLDSAPRREVTQTRVDGQ